MIKTTLTTLKEVTIATAKTALVAADGINTGHAWVKDNSEVYSELTKGDLVGSNGFYQHKHVKNAEVAIAKVFSDDESADNKNKNTADNDAV